MHRPSLRKFSGNLVECEDSVLWVWRFVECKCFKCLWFFLMLLLDGFLSQFV
jgi:hypothetical protein